MTAAPAEHSGRRQGEGRRGGLFPKIHTDRHGRMTIRCGGRKHYLGVDEAKAEARDAELREQ